MEKQKKYFLNGKTQNVNYKKVKIQNNHIYYANTNKLKGNSLVVDIEGI